MTTQPTHLDATTRTWRKPVVPRIFTIAYNHSKVKPYRSGRYQPQVDVARHETQTRFGTLYPEGGVGLDRGEWFRSLAEMKEVFETMGDCSDPVFLDEQESEGKVSPDPIARS